MSEKKWNNVRDPPPTYSLHQHACLSLNMSDRLRLIRFPSKIIDAVRQAILIGWPFGLQREKNYADAYEFQLGGFPWSGQRNEAVPSRVMMIHILSALHNHGWYLLASTDISKKRLDKDSLIFQLGVPPPQASFFAVSFNEFDKLRLISAPHELIPAVHQTLGEVNIQREKWRDYGAAYEFKLRGNPWSAYGYETVTSRIKLLDLLDCFTAFGWKLHASVDMSQGQNGMDTDTWFFRRDIQ